MAPARLIPLEPLTPAAFAPFGTVIQNPASAISTASSTIAPIIANQGSATKYPDICVVENFYHLASSRKDSRTQMSMFICKPRPLRKPDADARGHGLHGVFDISILERHPYTTQTFIPIGLSSRDPSTCFLVVVAPTASTAEARNQILQRPQAYPVPDLANKSQKQSKTVNTYSRARPKPYDNHHNPPPLPTAIAAPSPWSTAHSSSRLLIKQKSRLPKGTGPPILNGIRAFLARGDQAVTYGAGTWHAPMVVLGAEAVEFVVLQHANGVDAEDCQEFEINSLKHEHVISVAIDKEGIEGGNGLAELRSKF